MKRFSIIRDDQKRLAGYFWGDVATPRGVVQIAHGMMEHAGRYHHFAQVLNEAGFLVYAHDHRGHGLTAQSLEELGYFGPQNGWISVVEDLYSVTEYIQNQSPKLPLFLLGHSMGSFIVRHAISLWGDHYDGVILSGTGGDLGIMGHIGKLIAQLEKRIRSGQAKSYLLNTLSFSRYQSHFKRLFQTNYTPFNWLTRDQTIVEQYIADPYCGGVASVQFFYDLITGIQTIHQKKIINRTPKEVPILFISGSKDPVGGYSKGVKKVYRSYQKTGLKDLTLKLYRNGRHEILNELNRETVYHDLIEWIESRLKAAASY